MLHNITIGNRRHGDVGEYVVVMLCTGPRAMGPSQTIIPSYEKIAAPFRWKFTREDLRTLLAKTDTAHPMPVAA